MKVWTLVYQPFTVGGGPWVAKVADLGDPLATFNVRKYQFGVFQHPDQRYFAAEMSTGGLQGWAATIDKLEDQLAQELEGVSDEDADRAIGMANDRQAGRWQETDAASFWVLLK